MTPEQAIAQIREGLLHLGFPTEELAPPDAKETGFRIAGCSNRFDLMLGERRDEYGPGRIVVIKAGRVGDLCIWSNVVTEKEVTK